MKELIENRTPIIVGVGQLLNRSRDLGDAIEPIQLMLASLKAAEEDSESKLLGDVDSMRVIRGIWDYGNPARYLTETLGCNKAETIGTLFGGNQVQAVVNRSCLDIQSGLNSLVAITGAEIGSSNSRARKNGVKLPATEIPGRPDEILGSQKPEHHDFEIAKGIKQAIQVYPMYENAIRYARKESVPEHLKRVSELWARFNEVAIQNPNAWIQDAFTAEEIRTPTDTNRRISFPYTKMMNANMVVDMGAAIILCSVEKARELRIPEGKWVYPTAGVQGYDHFSASVRDNFHSSPGLGLVGRRVMELSKVSPEEIDKLNILQASLLAMVNAVTNLKVKPTPIIIAGTKVPDRLVGRATAIVKGDRKVLSIAAASIIAKVTRDKLMRDLGSEFPVYGWAKNAGYPTKCHMNAIVKYGVTPHHRRSFKPVHNILCG